MDRGATGSPWRAVLDDVAAGTGIPRDLLVPGLRLCELVTVAGEPALLALILSLEAELPETFPEELIDAVDFLGELLDFADILRSR